MFTALIIAEGASWWARIQPYLDYPGFEAWKFVNLAIFVLIFAYILTKKARIGEAFRARREDIKRELARAKEERDTALLKLKEVEERLARLDSEIANIKDQAVREAAAERERIVQSTQVEINKMREQATREIESAGKVARKQLRRYSAEQSVRLAEEMIRREMKPEDDARLIAGNIEDLGGPAQ
jgi:F-type H+-transporting ATPase subunit b